MLKSLLAPSFFIGKNRKSSYPVFCVPSADFDAWIAQQPNFVQTQIQRQKFDAGAGKSCILTDKSGEFYGLAIGVSRPANNYDAAKGAADLLGLFKSEELKTISFHIENPGDLNPDDLNAICVGWGLGHYKFNTYKSNASDPIANLTLPETTNKKKIEATLNSIFLLRNLVNLPSNDCGPDEIQKIAEDLAETYNADIDVISAQKKLEKEFPLIFTVGKASPRQPRLIDINWGKSSHPKITLVGKGVCFDTGGLNLKPGQYMRHMKKDMGGSAHVLGLAYLIMAMKLPVRLRVLIPAVENSVAGNAFRPGDIIKSRKGIYVENTNTDAEGRLILADALTYACENAPDLIIDYATLTGSARAGLGPDIPALLSNNDALARDIQDQSLQIDDPVWAMPLWRPYKKHIETGPGDMVNSAGIPGDLIYSALFLESFLCPPKDDKTGKNKAPDWVHLDCYAWEQTGRPGRPSGGADTGLLALFNYLDHRYGS